MQIDPTKLVEARMARAMSQEEAAIAADLSARTIQRIEAGHAASLESTKALLTIFGANIIYEPEVAAPATALSPWQSVPSRIGRGSRFTASLVFDGLRMLFAAIFVLIAAAKPIVPAQTGLFVRGNEYNLGLLKHAPIGAQEVLGYWVVPLMIAAAAAILVSVGRLRQFVEAEYVKRR